MTGGREDASTPSFVKNSQRSKQKKGEERGRERREGGKGEYVSAKKNSME